LECQESLVADVTPLKELLQLRELFLNSTRVKEEDVRNLATALPKCRIESDFGTFDSPGRTADLLGRREEVETLAKTLPALPPEEQLGLVVAMLKKFNPEFDGKVEHEIRDGQVVMVRLSTDVVSDISPLRALRELRELRCQGSKLEVGGRLVDLSPLAGLPLVKLECRYNPIVDLSPITGMKTLEEVALTYTRVSDLSPLKGAPLRRLGCEAAPISDLKPLEGMPLVFLNIQATGVTDLLPLKGLPLTELYCHDSKVSDLSPLSDLPLETLYCSGTQVTDLSPLKGMPLKTLHCDFDAKRDADVVRSLKMLGSINNKPIAEFWKKIGEEPADAK
jgi:Leucine-rich repeat (LRR) protein